MEEEDSSMLMGMSMKVTGRTIRLMELEYIRMLMAHDMKGNGMKISNMVMGLRSGQMVLHTKECTLLGRSMARESLLGLMGVHLVVNS